MPPTWTFRSCVPDAYMFLCSTPMVAVQLTVSSLWLVDVSGLQAKFVLNWNCQKINNQTNDILTSGLVFSPEMSHVSVKKLM